MSLQAGGAKRTTTLLQATNEEQWPEEERPERRKENRKMVSLIHAGSMKPSFAQSSISKEDNFVKNEPDFSHARREKSFMSLNFEINRVATTFVSQPNSMDLPNCRLLAEAGTFCETSKRGGQLKENMPIAEDGSFGAVTMGTTATTKKNTGIDISPCNSIGSSSPARTLNSLRNEIEAIPSEESDSFQNLEVGDAVCISDVELDNLAAKEINYNVDKVNLCKLAILKRVSIE